MSTLDNLKKEAKRWLKALRGGDADARARLGRAYPRAPDHPGLRDVQHALAREHGQKDWQSFIETATAGRRPAPQAGPVPDAVVASFLDSACWDHHTHGKADHRMADRAAQRFLAQYPGLATHDLYTALVCGNLTEVERRLAGQPEAAREPGGPRAWTPILYVCYTRFTHGPTDDNALALARLLLDSGANPNDFYMAGSAEYSCLVGAAGEGEQDSPRQPYAEALYALLLERGADPYDIQVLYDTHFSSDMIWWLELTYQHSVRTGRKPDWDDPDWSMFDMGGYGSGAHFVLNTALERLNLPLAEWALTHGASPNSASSSNQKPRLDRSLYDIAVMRGLTEFADLLRRHGARSSGVPLGDEDAFFAACMRLDRAAASSLLDRHPEYRRSHRVMFEAAKRDRPDVIELLLDLGVPLEIEDQHGTRALHHAAVNNALRAAQYLLDRGAAIDPRERSWGGAPIGWAGHGDHVQMLDLLSRHSKNVWTLAFRGYVDRLREILAVDPALARQVTDDGITPLWWLPDDDAKAMEIVELLLAAGADPSIRSREGKTASDWARQRGMSDVARRLVEAGSQPPAAVEPPNVPHFEGDGMFPATRPIVQPPSEPADAPIELRTPFTMRLRDNSGVSTTDVWRILVAARDGNLELVKELLAAWPALIRSAYNYMPPLHLAVREGHLDVVRCLAERGAVNPKYRTYPYDEPLVTVATDRGHAEIASVLEEFGPRSDPDRPEDESGHIEYESDWERRRFERLVASNTLRGAQELLGRRPELATDPYAFHCEGILSQPANRRYMKMLDLLMRHGARVPDVSKWAHAYYFKHDDVASLLMERGMNANHMNVHRTTLLHEMARLGELTRATLLLDHGADIDAVDQEFRSTPLGFAARWGQRKMVRLLLDRGADRGRSGAEWAAPLEWARRKGHRTIEADLR